MVETERKEQDTVRSALKWSREKLSSSPTSRLDSEILLSAVLGVPRSWVLAHPESHLDPDQQETIRSLVERRSQGEPVAYLRGEVEWHGLRLEVGPDVLIPRPETELLVEAAAVIGNRRPPQIIADIGTGSGAIAVALARLFPAATLYAIDISAAALAVARRNALRHRVAGSIRLLQGSLIEPLPSRPDLLVANLPYLADWMMHDLPEPVRYEPASALLGGPTGLELYDQMFEELNVRGWCMPIVIEIDARQARDVEVLTTAHFPGAAIRILRDYAGLERVVTIEP
jgi:release factor glutamine methyltransferase